MDADKLAIRHFIERVHGPEPSGWLVLWTRQNKATTAFNLAEAGEIDKAIAHCASSAAIHDIYAAVGLQGWKPVNGSRGKEDGVVSLPGLWIDIDIAGPAHKTKELPPAELDALSLIEAIGL